MSSFTVRCAWEAVFGEACGGYNDNLLRRDSQYSTAVATHWPSGRACGRTVPDSEAHEKHDEKRSCDECHLIALVFCDECQTGV